ncbi:GNAT family N-acetyltransferase [Methylobacter sp. sgz302048]|uniref:GNAT family N-acetyltransferase n=1 Tax=Methylobacter sp. sgz302048 TaxID=3455945 RepID=UPI003FA13EE1
MNITELQTSRTILIPFSTDHATEAFTWFGDPEVMKFTPFGPDKSVDATLDRIRHYLEHQAQYGFAKWIILERGSGKPIGDSGLMYCSELKRFELGYRLLPDYWNKGLATEAASAWVQHGAHALGLKDLMAFTHLDNFASIRVLEKVGFRFSHQAFLMGMPSKVFALPTSAVGCGEA